MGKRISVLIGTRRFPTKGELTEYVRSLIGRYSAGMCLAGDDLDFCFELFKFHPEAVLKFGPGITKVEVRLDTYGHKHFQVHRSDGTDDDISWVHCIRHARDTSFS